MVFHCLSCFYFSSEDKHETTPTPTTQTTFDVDCNPRNKLRFFTFAELKAATRNFEKDSIIGEGRLGLVYRGVINSLEHPSHKIQVAVKYPGGDQLRQLNDWATEQKIHEVIKHPNIVKLVGYCAGDHTKRKPRLLVYEYMPNTSVRDQLSTTNSKTPLSWTTRLKVAQDVARGLAYLHEDDFQIILRRFTSSNILLDDQWNAKLSDFQFVQSQPIAEVGIFTGYEPLEVRQGAHLSSKTEVWSYGVFLYELITGRHSLDRNVQLLACEQPQLDSKVVKLIIDPRLEANYSVKSALNLCTMANMCLSKNSNSRPTMNEVVEMFDAQIGVASHASTSSV